MVFDNVHRYVPKYLVSKHKIILKITFWVIVFTVGGRNDEHLDGLTDGQYHIIIVPTKDVRIKSTQEQLASKIGNYWQ